MFATLPRLVNISVLGSGSIGLLFANRLATANLGGATIRLISRRDKLPGNNGEKKASLIQLIDRTNESIPQPRADNGDVQSERNDAVIHEVNAGEFRELDHKEGDVVIVATKAYQAVEAVESITWDDNTFQPTLVLLCNGALGLKAALLERLEFLDASRMKFATTTHGAVANRQGDDFVVEHLGRGETWIEGGFPGERELHDGFASFGNATLLSTRMMEKLLIDKLAASCTINPISAIEGCRNGAVLDSSENRQLFEAVLSEISAVFGTGDDGVDRLTSFVTRVIDNTKNNKSSMLRDVERGIKTEVEYFSGYVVREGLKRGIATPANSKLYKNIRSIEE